MTALDLQLRAILDDPTDDAARLVYADLLEERNTPGDAERATFIRVQCKIACILPPDRDCSLNPGLQDAFANYHKRCRCHWCSLRRKEYLVARRYISVDWEAEIRQLIAEAEIDAALKSGQRIRRVWFEPAPSFVWRRGFIAEVRCTLEDWLCHGPAIVRQQPVQVVRATDREPYLAEASYWWSVAGNPSLPSYLPDEILELMPQIGRFDSTDATRVAISTALIRWAKDVAKSTKE